ncbi:hypothetical protein GS982_20545 [Rhodococcus hoagii]|nr:hypothetical protein [Prescottella equi]NKZ84585.1 hypothetical protein [Prescottella equi]
MTAPAAPFIIAINETKDEDGTVHVSPSWHGVDRPDTGGYAVRDRRTADRLVAAIRAGVVYTNPTIVTDVNGKTFVSADRAVYGRTLRADLRRLGF